MRNLPGLKKANPLQGGDAKPPVLGRELAPRIAGLPNRSAGIDRHDSAAIRTPPSARSRRGNSARGAWHEPKHWDSAGSKLATLAIAIVLGTGLAACGERRREEGRHRHLERRYGDHTAAEPQAPTPTPTPTRPTERPRSRAPR